MSIMQRTDTHAVTSGKVCEDCGIPIGATPAMYGGSFFHHFCLIRIQEEEYRASFHCMGTMNGWELTGGEPQEVTASRAMGHHMRPMQEYPPSKRIREYGCEICRIKYTVYTD